MTKLKAKEITLRHTSNLNGRPGYGLISLCLLDLEEEATYREVQNAYLRELRTSPIGYIYESSPEVPPRSPFGTMGAYNYRWGSLGYNSPNSIYARAAGPIDIGQPDSVSMSIREDIQDIVTDNRTSLTVTRGPVTVSAKVTVPAQVARFLNLGSVVEFRIPNPPDSYCTHRTCRGTVTRIIYEAGDRTTLELESVIS